MSKFMLGCNYWDSVSGTDMWKKIGTRTLLEPTLPHCDAVIFKVTKC